MMIFSRFQIINQILLSLVATHQLFRDRLGGKGLLSVVKILLAPNLLFTPIMGAGYSHVGNEIFPHWE